MMEKTSFPVLVSQDSDVGRSEKRFYEDRLRVENIVTKSGLRITLAVVSDGIGGENAGERAAQKTVDTIFNFCSESTSTNILQILEAAIIHANKEVFAESKLLRANRNMGATVAVAAICDQHLYIANVGDSRIYLIRGNEIKQITIDHSWGMEVYRAKKLSFDEAMRHPRKDELIRSIGYDATVEVDLGLYLNGINESEEAARKAQGLQLLPGDKILICSDGLIKKIKPTNKHYVEESEIVPIINDSKPEESANNLVKKALERGANDNVSAIVLEIPGGRPKISIKKVARYALPILVALVVIVLVVVGAINRNASNPLATLPPIEYGQILIADERDLDVFVREINSSGVYSSQGDLIDFKSGTVIQTGAGKGFIRLGFTNQVAVYLAENSVIVLVDQKEKQTTIQFNQGKIIVQLPDTIPQGNAFIVKTELEEYAKIEGSMMGVYSEPNSTFVRIDCLEGTCYYSPDGLNWKPFEEGWHVEQQEINLGTQNEQWVFVPLLVATPTASIIPTEEPTELPTPTFTLSGQDGTTPLPGPTQPPAPSNTMTMTPTTTNTAPTNPTFSPTCSTTPTPSRTNTITLTNTQSPTHTPTSTYTPTPTNTSTSTPTPTLTNSPTLITDDPK